MIEIRRRIGGTLYGTTITPRATPPSNDDTRLALNDWMDTSGLFHGVLDFAGAVALPDGTLDPAVDADGTHVTTAGHARLAAATPASIVTPPDSGQRTTGWRDITAWVSGHVSGRLLLKRTDLEMTFVLDELELSEAGTVSVNRFPSDRLLPGPRVLVPLHRHRRRRLASTSPAAATATSTTSWQDRR